MRSSWVSYFILLFLLGCQSMGTLGDAPVGPSLKTGNPGSGNSLNKTQDPDLGSTSDTPQTISSFPSIGSVMYYACDGAYYLCIRSVLLYDPKECPGERLYIEGNLNSALPDTLFDKVEVKIEYPGDSATIHAFYVAENSSGTLFGKFHTFIDAKPGQAIKISARRADHPGEAAVVKEFEVPNPLLPGPIYQGHCNPVLMDVMPYGDPVSDPGF